MSIRAKKPEAVKRQRQRANDREEDRVAAELDMVGGGHEADWT